MSRISSRFLLSLSLLCTSGSVCLAQATAEAEKPKAAQRTPEQKQAAALQIVPVAKRFLTTLNAEQTEKAVLDFDSEKRVGWHFIPMKSRKGLPLTEMEEAQKTAAMKLLRAAISKLGYEKATAIMHLEALLRQIEGEGGANERNPEKYYFTIFGKPAAKQHWGLSFEGHHLSLNFTMQGNRIVDSTPFFYATNPAQLKEDYGTDFPKGLQVLKAEEQVALALVRSLSETQMTQATLPGELPSEIRAAGAAQPPLEVLGGIAASELTNEQQAQLRKLMKAYTSKMRSGVAKENWKLIEEAGFEKIKFGWSGATRLGRGHYYVVQGPTFVIEFINVQPDASGNPANHIHCVWRDMQGDFDLPITK
ncbi:DUF3500 domain-containing protein [Aureliella helgolandensis]|uniref:DUF3500 domain-containing protein n=1 Tax=Aureliella helgolandensis TaxID=2527968 RepID=A0A518GEK9_9BACT|nr:DUF3500 domain-containing protein [Aureliella helgolandensis]QDV27034.1 hypothetical protein Q31a_54150 [Aureliella helgolandensis]